ncbi:hypothetical protein Nmel_018014, partial [Mimus melanotis]
QLAARGKARLFRALIAAPREQWGRGALPGRKRLIPVKSAAAAESAGPAGPGVLWRVRGNRPGAAGASGRDGHLQHQELGPAGPEEAPEQNGHQDHRQRLHRRHQQRDPGRAVPGHQGVHAQPQRGAEDHQEPHQDRDEAGGSVPQRAVQPRGAAAHGALPQEGSHAGHDGRELPPDRLHLRPQGHGRRADRVPGPAAPGCQRAPDGQVPLAHQPRLQPLCGLRVPVGAVRPGRALPHPPQEDLRGGQQDAGGGEHLRVARGAVAAGLCLLPGRGCFELRRPLLPLCRAHSCSPRFCKRLLTLSPPARGLQSPPCALQGILGPSVQFDFLCPPSAFSSESKGLDSALNSVVTSGGKLNQRLVV